MKRVLLIFLGMVLLLFGCANEKSNINSDSAIEPVSFNALVLKKVDSSLLVVTMDNKVFSNFEPVSVSSTESNLNLSMGDLINITFNGTVLESYPAQIRSDFIEVQKKAESKWPATSNIKDDYSKTEAIEDNCFVITADGVFNEEKLTTFIGNTGYGIAGFLRKVAYTVEGAPVIIDFLYDGNKYIVVQDNTRDSYAGDGEKIIVKEFNYINTYEKDGQIIYYLSNKEGMTNEEYEENLLTSTIDNSKETFIIYNKSGE